MENYDVLIVGGGMAGCILATRIVEHGIHPKTGERLKVAMIERGPYFGGEAKPGYGIPLRRKMFTNITSEFRQGGRYSMGMFSSRAELLSGSGDRSGTGTADLASIVGGGSLHWAAITDAPQDVDYPVWGDATGVDWTAQDYRAAGAEIRSLFNIHPRPDSMMTKGDLLFRDTAKSMGYTVKQVTLAKTNCIRCGFCDSADMCKYDGKASPLYTHLPTAEKLGVRIIPDTEVVKLVIEKDGARFVAKGAIYRTKGGTESVTADKVIAACGTFGTPALLFRSGYGRKDVLGSNLIAENDNIGRNIDARPSYGGVTGVFDLELSDGDYRDGGFYINQFPDERKLIDGLQIGFEGEGMATSPEFLATGRDAPQFGKEHKAFMRRLYDPTATGNPGRMVVLKRGTVSASVTRPAQVLGHVDANGQFQYELRHPSLIKRVEEGREIAVEILKKMGAKELLNATGPVRAGRQTMQIGSCRAGKDRSNSVVNSDFESHDVENLLIADGSSLPRSASYGYGAPVATVATFAAARIVAKHFSAKS